MDDATLGERVERSGSHDLFDVFPRPLEHDWVVRNRLPEVVDPVGLARRHDVIIDRTNLRAGVGVLNQAQGCHYRFLPTKRK